MVGVDGHFVMWLLLVVIFSVVGVDVCVWRWGAVVYCLVLVGLVGLLDLLHVGVEGTAGGAGAVGHGFVCDVRGDWRHWSEE